MATELEHSFTTTKPIDESFATVTDLEQVVPCVEGGSVTEVTGDDSVNAQIDLAMGAMSMKFVGTVEVAEKDPEARRALLRVKSKEAGGQGFANADVVFQLNERRHDPHQRPDHRQAGLDGRGGGGRCPRRADQGLRRQARTALDDADRNA